MQPPGQRLLGRGRGGSGQGGEQQQDPRDDAGQHAGTSALNLGMTSRASSSSEWRHAFGFSE